MDSCPRGEAPQLPLDIPQGLGYPAVNRGARLCVQVRGVKGEGLLVPPWVVSLFALLAPGRDRGATKSPQRVGLERALPPPYAPSTCPTWATPWCPHPKVA